MSATLQKRRDSNMELLRLVAMFLVLCVHANFAALGFPSSAACEAAPFRIGIRYILECMSLVCVNVFVLLSGWFGIRATKQGFLKFIFEVLFFGVGIWLVGLTFGFAQFSPSRLLNALMFTSPLSWFVVSYMGLYLLSPVLNRFIEKADKREIEIVLVCFFAFQTLYGWLFSSEGQFQNGYSVISFIGLYLLSRYIRLYPCHLTTLNRRADLAIYFGLCAANAACGYLACMFNIDGVNSRMVGYSNPLVIAASVSLVLYFSKLQFQNKVVNWLGAGAFGVFLLHLNENIYPLFFKQPIALIYSTYTPALALVYILLILLAYFAAGILIDHLRAWIWNKIVGKNKSMDMEQDCR